MEFITANEAKKQANINIELYIQKEIKDAIKAGRNIVRISSTKIPDFILDNFRKLGYNIEKKSLYSKEFMYKIEWE